MPWTKGMLTPETLAARAHDEALAVAKAAFGPEVELLSLGAETDWDAMLARAVHEHLWGVLKPLPPFDLMLDPGGRVVGFVDHEAYARADETSSLSSEALMLLLTDQEILPAHPSVVSLGRYPGPRGGQIHVATVEDGRAARTQGPAARWAVDINAARGLVAAIWPPSPEAANAKEGP